MEDSSADIEVEMLCCFVLTDIVVSTSFQLVLLLDTYKRVSLLININVVIQLLISTMKAGYSCNLAVVMAHHQMIINIISNPMMIISVVLQFSDRHSPTLSILLYLWSITTRTITPGFFLVDIRPLVHLLSSSTYEFNASYIHQRCV